MGDVVEISDYKPHASGESKCLACGYKWVAVAPVGVVELKCPECETMRGVWSQPLVPDAYVWYCHECGNDIHFATKDYLCCARCGSRTEYEELWQ